MAFSTSTNNRPRVCNNCYICYMNISIVNIDDLRPAEYNPKTATDEELADIESSIKKFGFVDPLIVNINPDVHRMNRIIGGHQRYIVAKRMGITEVPVHYIHLSEADERELNIRLTKNAVGFDDAKLFKEFQTTELLDWGFTPAELKALEKFSGDMQTDNRLADTRNEANYNISYNLIFQNEEQQARWLTFIKVLKDKHPEAETISQRIVYVIERYLAVQEAVDNLGLDEVAILEKVNTMCEQSLSPDTFEAWKKVEEWLRKTRKALKNG
jgi:hypothetical protein